MSKRLLLLSHQPEDANFLAELAAASDATFETVFDPERMVEFISSQNPSGIFIDVNEEKLLRDFEMAAQKRFGLFSDYVQPYKFHFLANRPLHENREVTKSPFFGSYFKRHEGDVQNSASLYGRFVMAGEQRTTHDLKHFLNDQANIQLVSLTRSDQKQEAAEAVRQYLIQAKIPGRISNTIANAVDELLMNAIFDAPTDDFGRSKYSSTARTESRELKGREQVKMTIGFDGFYIGVSVTDAFGAIDRPRLLNHVSMNYREREYTIRRGQAGAGLGIAAVFNSGGSLIYHCEAGQKTEATLLYKAYDNFREFKNQFHFFSAKFYV